MLPLFPIRHQIGYWYHRSLYLLPNGHVVVRFDICLRLPAPFHSCRYGQLLRHCHARRYFPLVIIKKNC